MRSLWLSLALGLLTLSPALRAQDGAPAEPSPSADGHAHAPPPPGGAPTAGEEEPDGPNLQVPAWMGGPQKAALEEAVAAWKQAYKRFQGEGNAAMDAVKAAIEKLEQARGLDPMCALPDYYLGIARQLTGEPPLAIKRLEEALRRNPAFHEAMVELGDAFRWAGNDKEAAASYERAIGTSPGYAHAYYMRALLRVSKQELEAARADLKKALELRPGKADYAAAEKQLRLVLDGPDWKEKFEVETRNYVVRTNVSQAFCQQVADHAELIRRLYEGLFPRSKAKRKSPIVVFKDSQEYHQNGGPAQAGGHYDPTWKQLFLFKYPKESDTLLVLYHEGFHQFLDGVLERDAPQWFNEGLADYFGPSEYYKEKGDEGMKVKPNPWRLQLVKRMLQRNQQVPWEKLMTMSQAEMYQRDAIGNHYAQAWSIVYFLAEADERAHFHYLKDYFQALRKGKSQAEAWQATFGKTDVAALEARWREFLAGVKE